MKDSKKEISMMLEDMMREEGLGRGTLEKTMTMITTTAVTMPTKTGCRSKITICMTISTTKKIMINTIETIADMMITIRIAGPIPTDLGSKASIRKLNSMIQETKTNADQKSK